MKKLYMLLTIALLAVSCSLIGSENAQAADAYFHTITLSPGWNVISTPRLVESHQFSVAETTANFDVYVLNPASVSGWSTMADINQTEFTPLYGYFINNKTGANQTLTLNYKQNVEPNQRLFSRTLSAGWNVVGVANPSYALKQLEPNSNDTNNAANILTTLSNCAAVVLDFTADQSNKSSVKVGDAWSQKSWTNVSQLSDLRETKAYAIYTTSSCAYQGSQNNDPVTTGAITVISGVVSVSKNAALADYSSSNPTGVPGSISVKIASFIITAGAGEATDITQIVLKDASATTQLGDNFTNLKLKNGTTQIGSTIGTLDSSGAPATYTFTPSSAIRVNSSAQYIVDVYADIKSSPQDAGVLLSPVAYVDSISATGIETSSNTGLASGQNLALQSAFISESSSTLTITNTGTTAAQQLVMGTTDVEVAKFKLSASVNEDITISDIYVAAAVSSGATGTFRNIKLYNGTTPVGSATNFGTLSTSTYAVAQFSGLSLTIPRNSNVILTVKTDVNTSANAISGATATFALLPDYDGSTSGNQESVVARGDSSGLSITADALNFSATPDAAVSGNQMTVYGTKLSVAYSTDTPSGVASPSASQTIMKFTVTNSSNVGNYSATLRYVNFTISQNGVSRANNTAVSLDVYKDTVTSSNLVGSTIWVAAGAQNVTGVTKMVNTTTAVSGTAAGFEETEIAAGATKTFIVILDTSNIGIGTADSLSISIADSQIAWRDGVSTSDYTTAGSVAGLPLTTKTMTY